MYLRQVEQAQAIPAGNLPKSRQESKKQLQDIRDLEGVCSGLDPRHRPPGKSCAANTNDPLTGHAQARRATDFSSDGENVSGCILERSSVHCAEDRLQGGRPEEEAWEDREAQMVAMEWAG